MGLNKEEKFFERVEKTGTCWNWTGAKNPSGYGILGAGKRYWLAHRYSLTLAHGDPGELCVLHKCDNPQCVRPDHLFLGTRIDNNDDRTKKGRWGPPRALKGSKNPGAKLTEDDVRLMRYMQKKGYSYSELSDAFDVSRMVCHRICTRKIWTHVE